MKNTFKISLPYTLLNPKHSKSIITHPYTGEKMIQNNNEEYYKPKEELINFLNIQLSNCVKTEQQKESIEKFFKERYFILCHSLPYKDSDYSSWTIFKEKDGSIFSMHYFTSGKMENMEPRENKFVIKLNGEIEELKVPKYDYEIIDEFKIYKQRIKITKYRIRNV